MNKVIDFPDIKKPANDDRPADNHERSCECPKCEQIHNLACELISDFLDIEGANIRPMGELDRERDLLLEKFVYDINDAFHDYVRNIEDGLIVAIQHNKRLVQLLEDARTSLFNAQEEKLELEGRLAEYEGDLIA